MAKVQGKKKAASAARRMTGKAATRLKTAVRTVKRTVARKPAPPAKVSKKKASAPKQVKRAAVALPTKPTAVPPPAAKAPVAPRTPVVPRPAEAKRARARRPRTRVHSDGAPVAAWLPQGVKPRPSSFIPAPPRAEAPSLIAAAPASSDRLIRPEDVTEFVTRTVPIRVDIEQGGGRVYIGVNPEEVTLRAGEGIEWDFRYLGGADVNVEEVIVEFDKPSPFSHVTFKSHKPGAARPHRQLSGAAQKAAVGKKVRYTIRAMNQYKTELSVARLYVNVQ